MHTEVLTPGNLFRSEVRYTNQLFSDVLDTPDPRQSSVLTIEVQRNC